MNARKQPLIVVCGPTACGKTESAIKLAKRINGEIVSADSMQIYKYMNIGTAKPTIEEMEGIKHYLIDELNPDVTFSVAMFKDMAEKCIKHIYGSGKIPIVVGGTGFYINALLKDNEFAFEETDTAYRDYLQELAQHKGAAYIHNMLLAVDPQSYHRIHANNVKRVIRALEYARLMGEPISAHNDREKNREIAYNAQIYILHCERQEMYANIEKRVDNMMTSGLLHEVEGLLKMGYGPELTSMKGLGYKELVPAIMGEVSVEDAVNILKRNTRRFAKRQLTWFNNQIEGHWVEKGFEYLI